MIPVVMVVVAWFQGKPRASGDDPIPMSSMRQEKQ